jgi:signal transduction histidine kinase
LLPDVGGDDEIAHLDGVFKDMAKALEQAEKERQEIERLKQEFFSMISHDLRTPLTSIQVFVNMLSKGMFGEVSEKAKSKALMADRNATRLIGLINDLLDVDKMESGQLSLAREQAPLRMIIDRAIDSVRGVSDQQGVSVESLITDDVDVFADSDRMVQVLVNLLGNAVKFSDKGSTVKIGVLQRGDDVRVEVMDSGRGVPENLRESIFERFKQVSAKDSTEKKGTGLGLAICKAIVEQHGGKIGCDSVVGHGSTFWFTLPLEVKDANLANAAERTKAAVSD